MLHQNFIGIDDADKTFYAMLSINNSEPIGQGFSKTEVGYKKFKSWVSEKGDMNYPIVASYEAGLSGPKFSRRLEDYGWTSHVIAPHSLVKSSRDYRQKTDPKDARRILDALRSHYLAGSDLSIVWLPDDELYEDREIVRERLDLGEKIGRLKNQVHGLFKRYAIRRPDETVRCWSASFWQWLAELLQDDYLGPKPKFRLKSLISQLEFLESQKRIFDIEVKNLSKKKRYRKAYDEIIKIYGVGQLTAMVFLTDLGDLRRFSNGKKLTNYVGLAPSSYSTGEAQNRNGHITKYGSWRIRKVLNQAAWVVVGEKNGELRRWYLKASAKIGKKKAIVGVMRKLSLKMWHSALAAI